MALVLCTGADATVLETRRLILEAAGHTVVSVMAEIALVDVCQKHSFDIAVVGQSLSPKVKLHIALLVKHHCPGAKILELYAPYRGKALDDADCWLEVPTDAPTDLADCVDGLARKENDHGS
jgi:hypothetical protein